MKYKVTAPIGNVAAPPTVADEKELRRYAIQITTNVSWQEKFEKDPINEVIEWLERAGYTIDETA